MFAILFKEPDRFVISHDNTAESRAAAREILAKYASDPALNFDPADALILGQALSEVEEADWD